VQTPTLFVVGDGDDDDGGVACSVGVGQTRSAKQLPRVSLKSVAVCLPPKFCHVRVVSRQK